MPEHIIIEKGKSYQTRNGSRASIWEWDEKQSCWKGTVKGSGITQWHKDGRDFWGTTEWDIVSQESYETN
jgi:hypothetical protein